MKVSFSERAYLAIRERILRGELALGEPLSRRSLGDAMGMSVLPVNEALQRLEADRLVESRPRAGTRVRLPSQRDIEESYIVREALEDESARLFTRYGELSRAAELVQKRAPRCFVQPAGERESDPEFQYLVHSDHAKFHMFIAESTECELLYRLMKATRC